ncbi:unnamed protein product, partial [Ilex paraguariensis]
MEAFPSQLERTVASALLLLSTTPPICKSKSNNCSESLMLSTSKSNSKSCGSSSSVTTSDDCSSAEVRAHELQMVAVVARCYEMKLKVVRKRRSKSSFWISDHQKLTSGTPEPTVSENVSEITEASSCVSSGASGVSSARSCNVSGTRFEKMDSLALARDLKRQPEGLGLVSAQLRSRAEAILKVLSGGCASEVRIRQLLGFDELGNGQWVQQFCGLDIVLLLKRDKVKRSGVGGRSDPYIYM